MSSDGSGDYGTRLSGYSTKNGKKLSSYNRETGNEYKIGVIEKEERLKFGPVHMTVWTLAGGQKYHYLST